MRRIVDFVYTKPSLTNMMSGRLILANRGHNYQSQLSTTAAWSLTIALSTSVISK